MALLVIPIDPVDEVWTQSTYLDGKPYRLSFSWSLREEAWYLDIADSDGVALDSGLRIVTGFNLLRRETNTALPLGTLTLVDMSGINEDPTKAGLGDRWRLMYDEASS